MSPTLSPTARRLIRSYGLLIVAAIAFLMMAVCVREKDRVEPVEASLVPITLGADA